MRGIDSFKDALRIAVYGVIGTAAWLGLVWLLSGCGGQQQPRDWGALTAEVLTDGVPDVRLEPCPGALPSYRLEWRREMRRWERGPRGRAVRLEGEIRLVEECPEGAPTKEGEQ